MNEKTEPDYSLALSEIMEAITNSSCSAEDKSKIMQHVIKLAEIYIAERNN